jgi:hypothetical protein
VAFCYIQFPYKNESVSIFLNNWGPVRTIKMSKYSLSDGANKSILFWRWLQNGRFFESYLNKKTEKTKITNPSNIFKSYKVADTIDPHLVIFLQFLIIWKQNQLWEWFAISMGWIVKCFDTEEVEVLIRYCRNSNAST